MKKFETQVCQYVNDLLRDQRNTALTHSAKKAIEVMQATLRLFKATSNLEKLSTLVVDGSRQGKFDFGDDGYIVNLASYFGGVGSRAEADFIGHWLREFTLIEWVYDFNAVALHNELWEVLFWGMKDLYRDLDRGEATRDKPQFAGDRGVFHYGNLGSSNLLTLWILRSVCTYVCHRFKQVYQRNPLTVQQAFWEDSRGIWVLYQHLNVFRLPTIGETDEFVMKSFRKMSAFVSALETISVGGGV